MRWARNDKSGQTSTGSGFRLGVPCLEAFLPAGGVENLIDHGNGIRRGDQESAEKSDLKVTDNTCKERRVDLVGEVRMPRPKKSPSPVDPPR